LSRENGSETPEIKSEMDFMAKMNLYVAMAHFVGKTLHIRPNEILDTWGTPELAVAFGYYANEISLQNYEQYKSLDAKERAKMGEVKKYTVKFIGLDWQDG